jgi:hypothetical protein
MFGADATTIANSNVDGILVTYSDYIVIRNFEITNVHRGVHFYIQSNHCEVSETYVHNNVLYYSDGVSINTCDSVYVHHNIYAWNYYSGAVVNNSSNVRFINNTIVYSQGLPFGPNGILFNQYCANLQIINNIVAFNDNDGVESVVYQTGANVSYNLNYGNGGQAWINIPVGVGNIYVDPLFTMSPPSYFSLQFSSPCINAGDPSILDPDGTCSDIGALYYPMVFGGNVTIDLNPINPPIIIPAQGGSFSFDVTIQNDTSGQALFDGWTMMDCPNGYVYGPIILRQNLILAIGGQINRNLTMNIPAYAMPGTYTMNGYVGEYPDTVYSTDSFTFEKLEADGYYSKEGTWSISGWGEDETFDIPMVFAPENYNLKLSSSPNPFNPETSIDYALPQAGEVTLKAYDVLGREVAMIYSGYQTSGFHTMVWNAQDLPSGIYFVHLSSNNDNAVKRVLLMK